MGNALHVAVPQFWVGYHFGTFVHSAKHLPEDGALIDQTDTLDVDRSIKSSLVSHLFAFFKVLPNEIDTYHKVVLDVKYVIYTLVASCPYTADHNRRGLNITEPSGPDWAELNAARSVSSASGVQSKHQGHAASHKKLVPYGLLPGLHMALGEVAVSPLDLPAGLPDDLDFACWFAAKENKHLRYFQRAQIRPLRGASDKLNIFRTFFESRRTTVARAACPTARPNVLDLASRIMRWPDVPPTLASHSWGPHRW